MNSDMVLIILGFIIGATNVVQSADAMLRGRHSWYTHFQGALGLLLILSGGAGVLLS